MVFWPILKCSRATLSASFSSLEANEPGKWLLVLYSSGYIFDERFSGRAETLACFTVTHTRSCILKITVHSSLKTHSSGVGPFIELPGIRKLHLLAQSLMKTRRKTLSFLEYTWWKTRFSWRTLLHAAFQNPVFSTIFEWLFLTHRGMKKRNRGKSVCFEKGKLEGGLFCDYYLLTLISL